MALGKRLIQTGVAACLTETTDIFGDSSGKLLYSFDTDASDASGVYNGTPTDVDFGVSGKINTGVRFPQTTSQRIQFTNPISNASNADFNVSFFVKFRSITGTAQNLAYVVVGNPSNQYGTFQIYTYYHASGLVFMLQRVVGSTIYYSSTYDTQIPVSVTANTYAHISINYTASSYQIEIFKDGVSAGTDTLDANTSITAISTTSLGYYPTAAANALNGSLDQFRIFNRKLTSGSGSEITTLVNEQACVHTSTTDNNDFPVTNAAYYKLDNSAEDSKGTNDGTETNIEYRFGRFGQAAVFNGSSSKITRESLFDNTQVKMSASVWVKATDYSPSGNINILDIGDNDTTIAQNRIFISGTSPHNIFASVNGGDAGFAQASQSFTDNSWNHIVATWDVTGGGVTNGIKIYLNGSLAAQGNSSQGFNSARDLAIGVNEDEGGDRHHFSGSIDAVRIFASELSAANVTSLYNEKPETDTSNFKTVLYKGTSASQYISNVGMDLETSGGLVWIKNRDQADNHTLVDSVRGISTSGTKYIASNTTDDEDISTNMPVSLEKNGFFVQGVAGVTNTSGEDYVSWVFKGGGTAVSNSDGANITSSVSANTAAGFSIVTYTGTGNGNVTSDTVGHGLSSTPDIVIVKSRTASDNWQIEANINGTFKSGGFGNGTFSVSSVADPTSTTFNPYYSNLAQNYVAYCFHSVSGYSKISTYLGAGSGTRVYTTDDGTSSGSNGFKPSFVVIKNADTGGTYYDWFVFDTRRDDLDGDDNLEAYLLWNTNGAEVVSNTGSNGLVMENDGFTLDISASALNGVGDTFLFMAFK